LRLGEIPHISLSSHIIAPLQVSRLEAAFCVRRWELE